jgi:hypothetical protein
MSACRSCGAEIEWAETVNGKPIPVDKIPVEDGNILLSMRWRCPPVAVVQSAQQIAKLKSEAFHTGQKHVLFKSHFATCPHAAKHRRRP